MPAPVVDVIAASNVYSRLMYFQHAGDVEIGHSHPYDHATLVSAGSVLYEVLDGPDGNTVAAKQFVAPSFVFVEKDKYHRLTALADQTICACIHALRSIDEDLVSPDCLVQPIRRERIGEIFEAVEARTGKPVAPLAYPFPAM